MADTSGTPALRNATPPSVAAGSASTSSCLADTTAPSDPNSLVCDSPTVVTTPMVGRATRHSSAMWPGPREPISTTSTSASSGADSKVIGTPISLLNDRMLAHTRRSRPSTAAIRSFVVVLPTDPVTPTTGTAPSRPRASRASAVSAASVSSTSTAAASTPDGPRAVR